ncbi:T9SS type B sorting domain-containing protein [Aureispira anguillae]|uniref:Gliding motility-associated C-terminal domain-containing protein n=1 Tax=Aureispira anguillae TaxID=2864201 RepID=A0A915YB76_9BACT|nr:T9SS type B sorting domain-containing protein [Aureispira anguillae]BDS09853.1 gliding motility-associated C-terminal domain-containing protein [Aureispira anguillae]
MMKFFIQCCLVLVVTFLWSTKTKGQATLTVDTIIHATCNASADGAILISVAGTPPFTYAWSNGATTQDLTGLFSGSFVVTVTDGLSGVTVSNVLTINAPPVINVITDTIINIECEGDMNGAVNLTVTGGVPGYTYIWDNGATTQDVTGLGAGAINLTVTDANGCTASSKSILLDSVPAITLDLDTLQNISCNGANDAYINTTAGGGVGNFTYLWNTGQTVDDISGLAAGLYTITATDSNGCTAISGPHTVTQPGVLTATLDSITHILCNGDSTGAVHISITGGTTPYTYAWSNGGTTEDLTGLNGGTYFVTVTDLNNCQVVSGPHVVNEPTAIVVDVDTIIHQQCANMPTGAVNLTVSGGVPAYTYLWDNGATTQDVSGLYAGANNVTVTDANGCTASAKSISLDSISPIVVALDSILEVTCNGANDGAVFIAVTGGTGGTYTYNWSNGATTQDITGLGGGAYSVTITDSNSCVMLSGPHIVNEPTALVVAFDSIHHVDCNGNANGAVFITTTGGTTNYTFNWSNGATTEDITGLNGGAYTVTVTDANGCIDSTGPHTVNEPVVLALSLDSIHHVDCNGNANGAVFITTTGGTTNYSFAWDNGATTEDITGLNGGTYTVTVTDANGCTITDTAYVVNEPAVLVSTLDSIVHVSCNGFGDGGVFITTTGGTANYTFNWSNGVTTENNTGLSGGAYTLTVTDANGCTTTSGPHTVNEPAGMTISLDSINHVTCNGAADGGVFVSVTGGAPAYSFAWDNGATTEDNTGLSGGTYTLTVTDANGCTISSGPHTVNEDALLVIGLDSINHVTCNGAADGAIGITVTGGVAGYSYLWSTGATTQDLTGLSGAAYTVTATDANGCTATDTAYVVNEPAVLVATLDSIQHVDCNGNANGAVFITTTGGTTNYTFNWSNGATTEDISGLAGGAYTVTVTDANGCVDSTGPHLVNEPTAINITLDSINHVTCNGAADGGVFVTVTGGTGAYSFAWDNGATTEDNTGLSGGTYALTVTDANGCTISSGLHTVNEDALLVIGLDSINHVTCNGAADGAIGITVTGGVAGYSYLWSTGATTQDLTGLSGAAYTVTATDANGCTATDTAYVVNEPAVLVATLDSIQHVDCNGGNDGAVFISIGGGTIPFSYNWDNGATTQDITGLIAGTYTVTVTDSNGCTVTSGAHLVNEPTAINITLDSINHVTCNGAADGGVFVTVTGGTGAYNFAWDNGATTEDNTGLSGGTYALTVTDANGCTISSGPHTVNEDALLVIGLDSINHVTCNGAADGAIGITVTGGVAGYSYLWSTGATTQDLTGLSGAAYTVTATDANGCTATDTAYVVNEPAVLVATLDSIQHVDCNGGNDGAVFISIGGGTIPFSYNWDNGATTQDITGLIAGTYTVTVTDSNGCTVTSGAHLVNEPTAINITLDSIHHVTCNGAADGGVFVTVTGGTGAYGFAWDNGATTEDNTGLSGGTYALTVTDANGCTATFGPSTITEPVVLAVVVDTFKNESCFGIVDGFISTSATGGTAPFSFSWSNGATVDDITGLIAGTYTVTITDSNSCTAIDSVTINDIPTITVTLNTIDSVSCNGLSDGAIDISTTMGAPGYTWNWSNGATTEDLSGLVANSYQVTVTDALGCTVTAGTYDVAEPNVLAITLDNIDSVSCNGAADGAVNITTTGGTLGYSFVWSGGQQTEDIANLSGSTNTVTVTDANGCTATSGPHVVNEAALLVITLDNIDSVSCNGASDGGVAISVTGGVPSYSYNWNNGGGSNQDLTNVGGNSYTVTVTDAAGCTVTSGPHVVDEPAPLSLTIVPTVPLEGCLGQAIGVLDATATGGVAAYTYAWSNAGTTASNTNLNAGVYSLTVTDANGCTITDIDSIQEPVRPTVAPFVGQAPITDTTINWGAVINIDAGNDQTANGVTYGWTETTSLGNVNFANAGLPATDVTPEPTTSGTYNLLVTATSADGCVDTGSVRITVNINDLIGMPTAFTPNGDNFNDYFRPTSLDKQFILEFKIYNRWGQIVFDGVDTDTQWDGTFNGVEQPTEVYIYVLRYQVPGQEERMLRGEMTLIR